LPLFALNRQGLKTEVEREWIFVETRGNERVEFIWRVLSSHRYGYPSPFARKVHRAVEYLLTKNGFPIPECLDFSLYEITFTVTPQRYLSLAKHCLKTAHQELMATGFLKKVWRKSKTDPKKWILIYHFGMRAKSEHKRGFNDDTYRPVILAVETADIEEIEEVIESEEEEQQVKPKRKQKTAQEEETLSPIAHDYQLSEEQLKKKAQVERKKAQQEEQRTLEEKAREIQEKRLLEALANFPEAEQWVRERVVEHVKVSCCF
jgi:hypothetical protein